ITSRGMPKEKIMSVILDNVFTILLATLIIVIYLYFKHAHTYWKNMGVPQLNPSFPFGDMASVIFRKQNMGDKIKEIYDKMKGHKYVGLYFFSRRVFLPLDPVLIKNILSTDFQHFYDRGIYYDEENDPLSAHLFSIAGPKWKHLRAKLTPAYSPGKLKYMFNTIVDCGHQMTDILKEIALKDGTVEIKEILARYTTDVIGSCAFGLECNCMRNPQAEFRLMGKRAFTQTVGDVLKMSSISSTLTMEEAAAQAFIFFLAGFETTSTTISFALKCTKTYQVPDTNVYIEEGLSVLIPCYGLHRDPEYFPDPELFDPNRFNEENKSKIWDYTYMPFGDGPRNCIGMRFAMIQAKIALSLTLRNFKFCLSKKTKLPLKMETKGIILAAIGGLWIDLMPV
ncbi:hypothetical protein NQ314_002462, partial [Rhamnusium bicolor]